MRIAITGSSGFIGAELADHFLKRGDEVVMMQRKAPESLPKGAEFLPFDLRSPRLPDPVGLTAVVHCAVAAYSKQCPDAEQVNITATLALRDFCRQHGVRFVFLSTMSAHREAQSVYGRHKFRLEQMLTAHNETVLKLGLVVGASGGLFSRISKAISKLPLVPLVDGGSQPIQTVAVTEVCHAVAMALDGQKSGIFLLGSEEVLTLRALYERIGRSQGRRLYFIPLPYALFGFVLKLPLPLPVSNENLLGLKQLRSFPTGPDLQRLGIVLRPLDDVLKELSSVQ